MLNRTRVKVCCIADIEEARTAVRLGADALGLVSAMPSGPGVIAEATILEIAAHAPPAVATFLLTSRQDAASVIDQQRMCRTNTLQFVDRMEAGAHAALRAALPGIALVQVIHVENGASVEEAVEVAPHVDALLLDSGRPDAATKILGGTGETHDWALSQRIVETAGVPVFLAGGLNAGNVAEAIRAVQPFGVDVCSGVRTDGALDTAKLERFVEAVWAT